MVLSAVFKLLTIVNRICLFLKSGVENNIIQYALWGGGGGGIISFVYYLRVSHHICSLPKKKEEAYFALYQSVVKNTLNCKKNINILSN